MADGTGVVVDFKSLTHINPSLIVRQRERGWIDFHPEDFCHRCGNRNITWWVDSDRFNMAIGNVNEIVCIACFVQAHEAATGLRCVWKLVPEIFRPVEDMDAERR